jgi:poly-gamma-glutamate capsule biosynthesis protein CapA/YwtB (metallophosphatase superfamily)
MRMGQGRRSRLARTLGAVTGAVAALVLAACSAGHPAPASIAAPTASPAGTRTASPAATPATSRATPTAAVTITAVGDMMLGNTPDLPSSPGTYFRAVKPALTHGAQIVFGNLEGTLTTATGSKCGNAASGNCFAFRNPPDYARSFRQAGFTILNDANNHSFDFGAAGQAQTVRAIHAAGLVQTGLPGQITRVRVAGTSVAFVAFAPYNYTPSLLDLPAARTLIERAAGQAQLVVVYMHAGAEGSGADHETGRDEPYLGEDRGNPEAFAHMAIDAGASLVIASGPHVLRGLQFYRGHLIAYSLGNFAGYGNFSIHGDLALSAILRVRLASSGRLEQARLYPTQFSGQGRPVPGGGAIAFTARLSAEDFGASAARIRSSGVIEAP